MKPVNQKTIDTTLKPCSPANSKGPLWMSLHIISALPCGFAIGNSSTVSTSHITATVIKERNKAVKAMRSVLAGQGMDLWVMLNMQALRVSDLIPGISWFLGFQSVIVRMTWWRNVGHDRQDPEQSLYLARLDKVPFGIDSLGMSLYSFWKKNRQHIVYGCHCNWM